MSPLQSAPSPDELLSEEKILELRPLLSSGRLREARNAKKITWSKGKRQHPWYRLADVDAYIRKFMEQPCLVEESDPSSSSEANGSHPEQQTSTVSGMTPELEERVAKTSAQQIRNWRTNGSRKSKRARTVSGPGSRTR